MTGVAVSLCDLSGIMVRPWAEAGCACICYDLQHPIRRDRVETFPGGGSITYRWADVRALTPSDLPRHPAILFAFPPCTHTAVSGARDFARKGLRPFIDSLELVESCRMLCEWFGCPWMLEQPVSRLSTAWRAPDHTFDPCDYGDPWTKRTCLWVGGGFVMPPKARVEPVQGSRMHLMPPGPDRANQRSATPEGFARAVFEANRPNALRSVA
jgi:hypothetical protein